MLFLKFHSGIHGLLEELGWHVDKDGSQECPNCGASKESMEHVLFECASYIVLFECASYIVSCIAIMHTLRLKKAKKMAETSRL